ncbi:hypothetical protein ACFLSA_02145 [Bacteroidota bacterium]
MKKSVVIYIQKLIALALIVTGGFYLYNYLAPPLLFPILFLIFGFLYSNIEGKKPPYLWGLKKTDDFINKKDGFWTFFKILLSLFGFMYDIVVWIIWGITVTFEVAIDIILLIKEIIFWIIHAIIWFLKLFVPPIIFLYRNFIHYCIKWIWWLYQLSFRNITPSVRLNYYIIALWGAVLSIFSVLLFYYLDIIFEFDGLALTYIGIVLAMLPLAWSFGELASIRENELHDAPYYEITSNFENGFESVKYVLYYVVTFLILFIIQILLDLFGWIPDAGLSLLGFSMNINSLISIVLIFLFALIAFTTIIIPTHLLKCEVQDTPFNDGLVFLKTIINKALKYMLAFIPSLFYGLVLMIIPALIAGGALIISISVKNGVLERRIKYLENKINPEQSDINSYILEKKIEKLNYYTEFPLNIWEESVNRWAIDNELSILNNRITAESEKMAEAKLMHEKNSKDLMQQIETARLETNADRRKMMIESLNQQKEMIDKKHNQNKINSETALKKYQIDVHYLKNNKIQIPIAFFFVVVMTSLLFGLVFAFFIAYRGNVWYSLYEFKEHEKPTYFRQVANELNEKDNKQPLLGFTLLAIIGLIIYLFYNTYK